MIKNPVFTGFHERGRPKGLFVPAEDHLAGLAGPHGFEALLEVIDMEMMGDDGSEIQT